MTSLWVSVIPHTPQAHSILQDLLSFKDFESIFPSLGAFLCERSENKMDIGPRRSLERVQKLKINHIYKKLHSSTKMDQRVKLGLLLQVVEDELPVLSN